MFKTKKVALTDSERLDAILLLLERLKELSADHVILIEGSKDRSALQHLGIGGDMFQVQSGGGPVAAAEYVEAHGGKAVVLTDWDRRGDNLAELLSENLSKDPSDTDLQIHRELASLCRPYTKDVESLDTFVEFLTGKVYEP